MSWVQLIYRHLQPRVQPVWLQRWRVRVTRRSVETARAHPHFTISQFTDSPRRLFIDVSVISKHDAGTGIQRVVRAVGSKLVANPPDGWDVIPVGATRRRAYHHVTWPSRDTSQQGACLDARPGDVFLGLDFSLDDIHRHRRLLARFKLRGGRVWFVMYDLLPLRHPDWFSDALVVRFRRWLFALAGLADGFYCISRQVEVELKAVLADRFGLDDRVQTTVLPMGWDLEQASYDQGQTVGLERVLAASAAHPTVLVVGTVEPRKGHADVLAAFEMVWAHGSDALLVFVGRPGWKCETLHSTLRAHPRLASRLFWLENASDKDLAQLYKASRGVIVASYAEGFGLPLIEAIGYGKPVLARDLQVFRQHKRAGVTFFPSDADSAVLASAISAWLKKPQPAPEPLELASWNDTVAEVIKRLDA